ncbi:hypothetical protein FN846DRAFT_995097 [Sphaerosporella brunnea]|uniref:Uncharacterized protein n=1 Tax=Sphaerosporella brunnea TaxID=1250544 RepID=A0A5J5EJQ8_9PEZI|nr:hypothetical protein FN846DRAFT_995097 [Sphaerosporella brunnea]
MEAEIEPEQLLEEDAGPSVITPDRSTIYRSRVKYLKADIDRMEELVRAVEAGEQAVVEQQPAVQLPPEVGRHGKIKELRRQAEALVETLNRMVIADEQEDDSEGQGSGKAESETEDSEGQGGSEAEPETEDSGQGGTATKEREVQGGLGAEEGDGHSAPEVPVDEDAWQSDHESDKDYENSQSESDSDSDSEESATTESSKPSEPEPVQYETQGLHVRVQNNWPNLRDDEKVEALDKGIADLKRKLRLKKFRPEGQHRSNYEAVLDFMRAQRVVLAGAKRRPRLKKFTAIKMASLNPPSRKDLALLVAMINGHSFRVQRRILRDETAWIKEREIRAPQQGKTSRLQSILEDEGVQLAVKEYTAQAGDKISAEGMRKAVERYIADPENSFDQDDGCILSKTFLEMEHINTTNAQRREDAYYDQEAENRQDRRFVGHHIRFRRVKKGLCVRTMERWLHWMGYNWKEVRKGIYKDGHEREDVVSYRQDTFLPFMARIEPRLAKWDLNASGELVSLPLNVDPLAAHVWIQFAQYPVEMQFEVMRALQHDPAAVPCELIPVIHDECTYNANDGVHHQWILGDHNPLRKKSRGAALMVSEFLTPRGRLRVPSECTQEEMDRLRILSDGPTATETLQCGGQNWWDQEYLIQQLEMKAIPIFNRAYPGRQALFIFDNATIHSAFATDALRVTKLNIAPGGKQPVMRPGWFLVYDAANNLWYRQEQEMQFSTTHPDPNLRGKQKGTRQILQERGLWPADGLRLDCKTRRNVPKEQRECSGTEKSPCCTKWLLARQPDFLEQKCRVQEVIEASGHLCIFLPKFHPELSWIEYYWGQTKRYTRRNCAYDIASLRENIP